MRWLGKENIFDALLACTVSGILFWKVLLQLCLLNQTLYHILPGTSVVPNSCLAQLPPPLYPSWPRCQMEMGMFCRLVPLWHEGLRHKNRYIEGKTAVSMLSAGKMWILALQQRHYSRNPILWHWPRNGMDTFVVICQCCRLTAWAWNHGIIQVGKDL